MPLSRADVLATAERSPEAASARDREAWVRLFAPDGRVEDPVGTAPHSGQAAIGRFFDTFIGPRDVAFHPDVDVVAGSTVMRDGVLEAVLGPITLKVPIYIRYDLSDDGGEPKIAALSAFWELQTMVGQFLRGGVRGIPQGLALARLLLVNQGVTGTLGFLRGFAGLGKNGRNRFGEFLADARTGDEVAVRRALAKDASLALGDGTPMTAADLMSRLSAHHVGEVRKVVASGRFLVAGVQSDRGRDIVVAEAAAGVKPLLLTSIRYFSDAV